MGLCCCQMHRRKGSLGGYRYVAKRHRANGQTVVMPLSKLLNGPQSGGATATQPQNTSNSDIPVSDLLDHDHGTPVQHTSAYYASKAAELAQWEKLRPALLQSAFDRSAPTSTCLMCESVCTNIVMCDDCGPAYSLCPTCAEADHKLRPLHSLTIWRVSI